MNATPVSVIVVSRGRPELLTRCLTGLGQLFYPSFEIIVVADPAGIASVAAMGWDSRIKTIAFDQANISAARNQGIARAAGKIVAFIDDDAVPEPTWLDHLTGPFADPGIGATGGYVRGRNGISFQWRARLADRLGYKRDDPQEGEAPYIPDPDPGLAVKTEGTNCAFRRDLLARLGGFDPSFRFYLDETDLNLRVATEGVKTAVVPLAQVHHGYAASERRGADRAPRDLFEIGASTAVFWRKHAPADTDLAAETAALMAGQRTRLIRYMVDGGLEPRDVNRLLQGLLAGFEAGGKRSVAALPPLAGPLGAFLPFRQENTRRRSIYLAGRVWNRRRLARHAKAAVQAGAVVTLYRFDHSAFNHRVRFRPEGYWEQRGGLFGRAERHEPVFRLALFHARVAKEWRRVAKLRHVSEKMKQSDDGFPHSE